jgi:hypothetical protein
VGERGAILFTIIECCRRLSIDPYAYLRDGLTRLPRVTNRQVKDITQAAWANALKPAPLPTRSVGVRALRYDISDVSCQGNTTGDAYPQPT